MGEELSLDTILPKDVNDLTGEEKAYLIENQNQLTDEQKEKFASVLKAEESSHDEGGNDADDKNTEGSP